jgi:chromate transporter
MSLQLFWRFVVISTLAFGGGQAALPLVEQMTVGSGWVSAQDFSTALAFSYVTPGPVLILATFIGYRAAGLGGALGATFGAFMVPWFLATAAAQLLRRVSQSPWLQGFGRGAGPAVVGLLVVTALDIGKEAIGRDWPYAMIAALALALSLWRKVPPFVILLGGAFAGIAVGLLLTAGLGA